MVCRDGASVLVPAARLHATVRARGRRSRGGLGDRVTRRGVRHHIGHRADRDERAGRQPPVDPGEAGDSDVARNLCPVASHP
ncbi:MAG TPA: hypothetical protein VGN29_12610 [Solirubrobacteraceae bacterium]|jgi:hypothetical protein|nr:hypothetical protein [Solirubrobacteraceae bacterium]